MIDNLEQHQMVQFHEFISTTYDKKIAEKYANKENGSYLIEINVPEDDFLSLA
jgi:hypothetical protein